MNVCSLVTIGFRAASACAALATAPACTVTPIDAVTELDGTGSTSGSGSSASNTGSDAGGGTATPTPDAVCPAGNVPDPGEYAIVSGATGACLSAGGVTDIQGAFSANATGYEVVLDTNCNAAEEQRWEVGYPEFDSLDRVWHVQVLNLALELNLDIEAAGVYDGTRAVLYNPHGMENQRFQFIASGTDQYMISPRHVDNACLQAMADGSVEMYGCNRLQPAQQWQLASVDCVE